MKKDWYLRQASAVKEYEAWNYDKNLFYLLPIIIINCLLDIIRYRTTKDAWNNDLLVYIPDSLVAFCAVIIAIIKAKAQNFLARSRKTRITLEGILTTALAALICCHYYQLKENKAATVPFMWIKGLNCVWILLFVRALCPSQYNQMALFSLSTAFLIVEHFITTYWNPFCPFIILEALSCMLSIFILLKIEYVQPIKTPRKQRIESNATHPEWFDKIHLPMVLLDLSRKNFTSNSFFNSSFVLPANLPDGTPPIQKDCFSIFKTHLKRVSSNDLNHNKTFIFNNTQNQTDIVCLTKRPSERTKKGAKTPSIPLNHLFENKGFFEEVLAGKEITIKAFLDVPESETRIKSPEASPIDLCRSSGEKGKGMPLEITFSTIRLDSGETCYLMSFHIANERTLYKLLERTRREKDDVISSISHELRTPLNSTIGLTNEALSSPLVSQEAKEAFLEPALKSAKLLLHVINDIIDFTQIQMQPPNISTQKVNIQEIIHESISLYEEQFKAKGISLELRMDNKLSEFEFHTDPERLLRVMLNLLSNSCKFTERGTVIITVRKIFNYVRVDIEDSGVGMKEEEIQKIIKHLSNQSIGKRLLSHSTGAGLGLWVANANIKLLGPTTIDTVDAGTETEIKTAQGRNYLHPLGSGIHIESKWGVGTTVSFLLETKPQTPGDFVPLRRYGSTQGTIIERKDSDVMLSDKNEVHIELGDRSVRKINQVHSRFSEGAQIIKLKGETDFHSSMMSEMVEDSRNVPALNHRDVYPSKMTESLEKTYEKISPGLINTKGFISRGDSVEQILLESDLNMEGGFLMSNPFQGYKKCNCPRVLIVDDDGFNLMTLGTFMNSLGVKYEKANSGQTAIDIFNSFAPCNNFSCKLFRIVLMDANMPLMNGYEATKTLKNLATEKSMDVRIIGCTAYTSESKIEPFYEAGAVGHVTKPVDKAQLSKIFNDNGVF